MIIEYIQEALQRAHYELIRDDEPYYGEIPDLKGVWASGKTLEECRQNLIEVLEGWILLRLRKGLPIPHLGDKQIEEVQK
ncbi:MAG: type II toxin-antitoxin system HicB family antitoxin [Candidatus Tectomicrobia bacterium]|nr:type II toxin-antitoxin system HicB family antitoxin [Candidatus Tectomicrobia bacterium]